MRSRNNDYSVPVAHAHREVLVKGNLDEVVIAVGAEEIARHRRSYESADFIFNLALLEQKVGAWTRRRHIGAIADEPNACGMLTRRGGRWPSRR